ncbi:MAG: glycoside hydrolase family 31 protein [Chitinophagaceae bacterium]|nr:glycoside hydrolase family 31 protein [Chitinophagaceae bacterium]
MKRFFWGMAFSLFTLAGAWGQTPRYTATSDGVIVYPDLSLSGSIGIVRIQWVNDQIVRVTAAPDVVLATGQSEVVTLSPVNTEFQVVKSDNQVELIGKQLRVLVHLASGAVTFQNMAGESILAEKRNQGRIAVPVMEEGKPLYKLTQYFSSDPNEYYFGLGQHQDDVWNYKGRKTIFFQNNTEVAVPFLLSTKNYGILWDNYSYGEAGDVRPLRPLSALQLESKHGEAGWLTASYYNDKNAPEQLLFEKAESEIDYPYINDLLRKMPKEFKPATGKIVWEGKLSGGQTGTYQFRFTYGGYFKAFINGKLTFDKWRQAWNPGTALFDLVMEKGKKYDIRLEWIPDGGESYVSAQFLPPPVDEAVNTFAFLSTAARQIDYYFVLGADADGVIKGYRHLTGKAPIVPKWAMGYWQSRERYKSQDEVLNTVAEFRKRRFPIDNIVQDWFYWKENEWGSQAFDPARFPQPDSMIATLHNKYHARFMISVWPKFYEGIPNYEAFMKNGWLYTRNIADRQKDWVGPGYVSTFYDVFNEKARQGFWALLDKNLFSKKVDAWWMDASEPDILSNVSPEKRKQQMQPLASGTAAEFMNAYPLMNAKGIYEGQRGSDSSKRVFLLTRSAFAGSQRYAASIWSGDIGARWEDMRTQIIAGLNYSMSGLPYWTLDIGGFATETRYNKVPMDKSDEAEWRELQTRWYQWGSFLPLFRSHGQFPLREPFNIAPEGHQSYQSMLYYNQLRYRLLPYYYSLAGWAYHKDYTILRGLNMDFSVDRAALSVSDQFMCGPSLLINPIYQYKAVSRSVYLPGGQGWYDFYSGKYFAGAQTIQAEAPYHQLPVFVKEGSIIPAGPSLQYTDEKPADPLTLYVYSGKDASFTLYEDEGVNYNYEKGKFAQIEFTFDQATKTLTIGDRLGEFEGMLRNRVFYVKMISPQKPAGFDLAGTSGKKINYSGKKIVVKLK